MADRPASSLSRKALLAAIAGGGAAAGSGLLPTAVRGQTTADAAVVLKPTASTQNVVAPDSPQTLPLSIVGAVGQDANLTEWRTATGDVVAAVTPAGRIERRAAGDGPEHAAFSWEVTTALFNGRRDPVSFFGYNIGQFGRRIIDSEPTATYVIEADYDDGQKRTLELYAELVSADGSASVRPFFWQARRDATRSDRFLTRATIMGDPLIIEDPSGAHRARFDRHGTVLYSVDEGYDTELRVEARSGRGSYLALGADGKNRILTLSALPKAVAHGQLAMGGRAVAHFFGNPRGAAGAAISVGVQDSRAAGTFAVGDSVTDLFAIVARGRTSQRADLQQWQDADATMLAAVTPAGRLRWSSGNERAVVGASGPAAPTPARPVTYLEVVDSTGRTLLLPAYAEPGV